MNNTRINRRTLIKRALVGIAAVPAAALLRESPLDGASPSVGEELSPAVATARPAPGKTPHVRSLDLRLEPLHQTRLKLRRRSFGYQSNGS
jgi:hypothetical protein